MKIHYRIGVILVALVTGFAVFGVTAYGQTPGKKSIHFGYFTPDVNQPNPSLPPKNRPNIECTEAWAESWINKYKSRGQIDTLENASKGLVACDVYRYIHGCTDLTRDECSKPCIYIKNGPTAKQIQSDPIVKENLDYFHAASTELFTKYWLYTKAVTRFDIRNGFGLQGQRRDEAINTLRAMSCRERATEINHHVGTPLYFYPVTKIDVQVQLPSGNISSITAHPDGTFEAYGRMYTSLAYDLQSMSFSIPKDGLILEGNRLERGLSEIAEKLDLQPGEKEDFVKYWTQHLPRSNYYFISLFDENTAQKLANWKVTPRPDTEIRYIFYFKPLVTKPINTTPITSTPKTRKGFTVVDWGGIIDW